MATVKFYLDKERKGGCLILVTFTFNHERLRFSTGLNVPKKAWDDDVQKAKPVKDHVETNKHLRDVNSFLLNSYDELFPSGAKISKEEVKMKSLAIREAYQVFAGRKDIDSSDKTSLVEFIPIFQARYKNKVSANHIQHFNGIKTHLETFQKKTGTVVTFNSIGKEFYINFTDYLKASNLKPNTIGSHIRRIKRLMNEANEDKLTTNQEHRARGFKVQKEDADTIYLTEDDIHALYKLDINDLRMTKIRDLFVLNCHTGLRHSDWSKVTLKNIHENKLYVKTQKTNEPVIIPVHPIILEIINRYGSGMVIPTNQETNRVLRWIGEYAVTKKITKGHLDKWLQIRTHTVRRSFATNAYLSGVPMLSIMQITGHRTTESFLRYIRISKLENAMKLKDHPFFNA
jgi:integrase